MQESSPFPTPRVNTSTRVSGRFFLPLVLLFLFTEAAAQGPRYDTGTPRLRDLYVDPIGGSDAATGVSPEAAFRTLQRAWREIPSGVLSETGYRIRLMPGSHDGAYLEDRQGTREFPIVIEPAPATAGIVVGAAGGIGGLTIFNASHVYLQDFKIAVIDGDAFHCERCDHILLRGMDISSQRLPSQNEAVKINQSRNVFIEESHIHGAGDNSIDMVAVQDGHIARNRIRDANDWCLYVKGGSARLRIEANEISDCGTGGFTAGQGTGFQFMVSPWIHYEAYDIKFVNNIIHDTTGAGLGVNGGYNILLAFNTLFRTGQRSHGLEFVFGMRSCDGQPGDLGREACSEFLNSGGWGTVVTDDGTNFARIPNRNVFVFNNILSNPPDLGSAWQHLAVSGPFTGPSQEGSNIPGPARADENLRIVSNVFWNGPPALALGVEDPGNGCQPENSGCNATQLSRENSMNTVEPDFVDVDSGNVFPSSVGSIPGMKAAPIPPFTNEGRPERPAVPAGDLENSVTADFSGTARQGEDVPGALVTASRAFTQTLLVPVVLRSTGLNDSFFTTEISLLNRGKTSATARLEYFDQTGTPMGSVTVPLEVGRQIQVSDIISWLREKGVSIPAEGNQIGSLRAGFENLSSAGAGMVLARTATPVAGGRAGLSYPGIPYSHLLSSEAVFICSLKQDSRDRSNVAFVHAGNAGDGPITLRVTVFDGSPEGAGARELPVLTLAPGSFRQINAILEPLGLARGFVKVERIQGTAPFYAFGVVNDMANSDGSFLMPEREFRLAGRTQTTIPAAIESWPYQTELFLANLSSRPRNLLLRYQASALGSSETAVEAPLTLLPHESRILPSFVQYLRETLSTGIPAAGQAFVGSVRIQTGEGERDLSSLVAVARTVNPGPSGFYGLSYGSTGRSEGAVFSADIQGLRQDAENRSNLALVNTGERDSSESRYRIEVFDGDTGTRAALHEGPETTLPAGAFTQINRVLSTLAPGVAQGWIRITRRTGSNPFIAYGVINDGAAPGERSGDGAFIGMQADN